MKKHLTNLPSGRPKGIKSSDPKLAKAFGLVLKKYRIKKKLTQVELGYFADVSSNNIGKFERGQSIPTLPVIIKLTDALNLRCGDLIDETVLLFRRQK